MKLTMPVGYKQLRAGMNAIELGCCLGIVVAALVGFTLGQQWYGWWGAVAGLILLPLALQGLIFLCYFLNSWMFGSIPWLPVCPNNCCRRKDYKLSADGPSKDWYWQCNCGTKFKKAGKGDRRFMLLNDDNSLTPYLRYVPCVGWRKDKGNGTGPCW